MDFSSLPLHDLHPRVIRAVIEQPRGEPVRLRYDPETGGFLRTQALSLLHERGYRDAYGWIAGTGVPPGLHHDVFVLTELAVQPGDVLVCQLCGMFQRGDGDHKFVAIAEDLLAAGEPAELFGLSDQRREQLFGVYPIVGLGEGWFGAEAAALYLSENEPTHD